MYLNNSIIQTSLEHFEAIQFQKIRQFKQLKKSDSLQIWHLKIKRLAKVGDAIINNYHNFTMKEVEQVHESMQEVLPTLSIAESTQVKSINLNELIKIHRYRQKYEIVDPKFNNSYIQIQNKIQPIEIYYQYDRFRSYLQDLNMVYFKDIEFSQNVRLQYVIRRLDFTLYGEQFDFKEFLKQNRIYEYFSGIFSSEVLEDVGEISNERKVLNVRNQLFLAYLYNQLNEYEFSLAQKQDIHRKIRKLYAQLKNKLQNHNEKQQSELQMTLNRYKCAVNSLTNQSEKSHERYEQEQNQSNLIKYLKEHLDNNHTNENKQCNNNQDITYYWEDLIYEEEITLKIVQTQLQNYYLKNQISDPLLSEQTQKLQYLQQINLKYIQELEKLKEANNRNRHILKKLQRNIGLQYSIGSKCIVPAEPCSLNQCFPRPLKIPSQLQIRQRRYQKVEDTESIKIILSKSIQKLKKRQIADSIEKVFQIERDENKGSRNYGKLTFSVCFQYGIDLQQATFAEKQFLQLNDLREESTLTSYLTPMKSNYSYISHNVFTFLRIQEQEFPYDKLSNNNEQVMRKIKNKISRHHNVGKNQRKDFYYDEFRICHNCRNLCSMPFLKQCRKRVKQQDAMIQEEESGSDDDSLYTEKNFKSRRNSAHIIECSRYFCIFCIKNQFGGKLFSEKGWCPACLDCCHCNLCLRDRMIKKLVDLYGSLGGEIHKIKSQRDIVQNMRVKRSEEVNYDEDLSSQSMDLEDISTKAFDGVIKRQIIKGYLPRDVCLTLQQQQEVMALIVDRQNLKFEDLMVQKNLFRHKLNRYNFTFDHLDKVNEEQQYRILRQKRMKMELQREEKLKKRQQLALIKSKQSRIRRKSPSRTQQFEYFYKFPLSGSEDESSSYHIKKKRNKEKIYEPEYNF